MPRRGGTYFADKTEQLFQNVPVSGRDVDIANFFIRQGGPVDSDRLADLLAAYRAEQEEKLESRISELSDTVELLRDELSDYYE
jgi:hypothetical protein